MGVPSKFRDTIDRYGMLEQGDRVLVAVSGGPDSIALLNLLRGVRERYSLQIEVAHLIHGLRGEEAREDALFVRDVAAGLSVPFHVREVDLPALKSQEGGGNFEAMGRAERYRFFSEIAAKRGMNKVATGHNRDDQIETLFLWFLRGSGRRGLGGISPQRNLEESNSNVMLIRPLIKTSREEILSYLRDGGLPSRTDETNGDPKLLRNWIRLELLPLLKERLDPGLDRRLLRMGDLFREEEVFLNQVTEERLAEMVHDGSLAREEIRRQPRALQRRMIRLWLERNLAGGKNAGFDRTEEILEFLSRRAPQGSLRLSDQWILSRRYGRARLEKQGRGKPMSPSFSYSFPREGELAVPEARTRFRAFRENVPGVSKAQSAWEALFDLDLLPRELTLRSFRPGDRFQPLGMEGHKKLKDLFIEKKVPLSLRRTIPLLVAGSEILWIPGYGRSEMAKIASQTREILRVQASPMEA